MRLRYDLFGSVCFLHLSHMVPTRAVCPLFFPLKAIIKTRSEQLTPFEAKYRWGLTHTYVNLIAGSSPFSKNQLEHLEVHGSHIAEAWLGEFWALPYWRVRWVQLCGSLSILWHCLFWTGMKTDNFQSCGHCWVTQICWHIECSTFTASPFRIWNSSTGIPSPPLALFVVTIRKTHLTSHSRMSGCRWVITPLWLSGMWNSFLYSSCVYSWHLF